MAKKKTSKTSPKPQPARPYHLLAPFIVSVVASLLYVAPQEVPNVSMAAVKVLPILSLMWAVFKKEKLEGEVLVVFIGLFLSLFGDYYMVWPEESFLEGTVSFMVVESFYITSLGFKPANWMTGPLVYSLGLFWITLTYPVIPTPVLKIAVTFYALFLSTLLWRSIDRARFRKDIPWERRASSVAGAALIVASDMGIGTLQLGRLVPHFVAQFYILSTYYLAQLLLVMGACGNLWKV